MSTKDEVLTLTDKVSIIKHVSIFSEVPSEVIAEIAMVATQHSIPAESVIINKGDVDLSKSLI